MCYEGVHGNVGCMHVIVVARCAWYVIGHLQESLPLVSFLTPPHILQNPKVLLLHTRQVAVCACNVCT